MNQEKGMTIIVKTITRFTVWLIFLYGLYIIIHGHLSPGGGFAGGVIISLSFLFDLSLYEVYIHKMSDQTTYHIPLSL